MPVFILSVMLKMQKAGGTRAGLGRRSGLCCQFYQNRFTAQRCTSLLPPSLLHFLLDVVESYLLLGDILVPGTWEGPEAFSF